MDNQNKITGIVDNIDVKSGVSQSGKDWTSKTLVIREVSGQYPQSAVIDAFGDKFESVKVGDLVTCYFNLKAREYNGKWFQTISAWKIDGITPATAQTVAPVRHEEPVPQASGEITEDTGLEPKPDDLPF